MRFQESSRRVDVACWKFSNANVHSDLCKRICWPMYQRCAPFFGALGGSKDVMGVRWERLPSVYSQTFLLLKLLRAATKHFQIVQDAKKYESNF